MSWLNIYRNLTWLDLILIALAAYRLTWLLADEAGPFQILVSFRRLMGIRHQDDKPIEYPNNLMAQAFSCFWCLSGWVVLLCLGVILIEPLILLPFSIWGLVILIQNRG